MPISPAADTTMTPEDALRIGFVKARYCRLVDTKRWAELRRLFTPGARFEGFASAPNGATVEAFVQGVSSRLQDAVTVHRCCQPEMRLVATDVARAIWSMTDYNEWRRPLGIPGVPGAYGFRGFGYYEDEYRRVGDGWLIAFSRLVRLRVDPILAGGLAPDLGGAGWLVPSPDWLG